MRILKGPSDDETMSIFNDLTANEIFELLRKCTYELDEKWFQIAVDKGLLIGLSSEAILLKAAEGNSLKYLESAHIQLIKDRNDHIPEILDNAMCGASKYGKLQIIKYLYNFGSNINLTLIHTPNDRKDICEFAYENGARIENKIEDRMTGVSHNVLWYALKETNLFLAEYADRI